MSQYLSCGEFKWVKNIDNFDQYSISRNDRYGYILEVNLKYPDEIHNLHNNYQLVPEKIEITYDMLSEYCKKIAYKYNIKIGGVTKLVPNLCKKTNYVVHYMNLKLYLSLGIKMIKIHKILKYKQSNWMKKSNDLNTEKRKKKQKMKLKKFVQINK